MQPVSFMGIAEPILQTSVRKGAKRNPGARISHKSQVQYGFLLVLVARERCLPRRVTPGLVIASDDTAEPISIVRHKFNTGGDIRIKSRRMVKGGEKFK